MNKTNNQNISMLFYAVVSALVEGFAQSSFVIVAGLFPGGFSGISRLVHDLSVKYLSFEVPYALMYYVLNIIAAIIVFKTIGKKFTIFSVIQVTICSLSIQYMKPVILVSDPLLLSIFGGIINGFGCGLSLSKNFSSGGTDFLNVYFSHKYNRSIINYILLFNCIILALAGYFFGFEVALYSIIYQYCTTEVVKRMHKRYTHDTITIITTKPEEVTNEIMSQIRHGITITKGEGAYTHKEQNILYTVVNTFQTETIIQAAKKADPNVFINIQTSKQLIGNYYQLPLD